MITTMAILECRRTGTASASGVNVQQLGCYGMLQCSMLQCSIAAAQLPEAVQLLQVAKLVNVSSRLSEAANAESPCSRVLISPSPGCDDLVCSFARGSVWINGQSVRPELTNHVVQSSTIGGPRPECATAYILWGSSFL